ncbi:hypothetical protein K502DRAFT_363686 [Neoconidiobolus thromboides FSU 785]|nr:hypothetical protein K502DRAFT_363686 [Neoconidiobolus thromboides FSU 785]
MFHPVSKRRIRSKQDVARSRMDQLNGIIQNYFAFIKNINDPEVRKISYDYLSWVNEQLKHQREEKDIDENERETIRIGTFKRELGLSFKKHLNDTVFSIPNANYHFASGLFDFGKFLETGTFIFTVIIDPYNLWLGHDTILQITRKDNNELLTYVFFAFLARFTLRWDTENYKVIYSNSLKNIRLLLPNAYSKPTYNNIVALGLMSYLALSHANFHLVERYFFSSVRLAQMLGYDTENSCVIANTKPTEYLDPQVYRGKNLWNALYVGYLSYSAIMLDFPVYHFEIDTAKLAPYLESINFKYKEVDQKKQLKKESKIVARQFDFFDIITNVNLTIVKHALKVKSEKQNELALMPNDNLRLPSIEFNHYFNKLMNLNTELDQIISNADNTQCTVNKLLKILTNGTIIVLCYPLALIYPKPIEFKMKEMELLYNITNTLFDIIFQPESHNNLTGILNMIYEVLKIIEKFEVNQDMFSCSQFSCLIYIYFNIIHQATINEFDMFYRSKMEHSMTKTLVILDALNLLAKNSKKKIRNDAILNLRRISKALNNFVLPTEFIDSIKPKLCF